MRFGIRHAIAIGIIVIAGAAIFVLRHFHIEMEVISVVAATAFITALTVAFSGKCCGMRKCKGGESASSWMPWLG